MISQQTFYLYYTYLNPARSFNLNDLVNLFSSQNPILITGDMNSWYPLHPTSNSRGKVLAKFNDLK